MVGEEPRVSAMVDAVFRDVTARLPSDGGLVMYFLYTALAFLMLDLLQAYVQTCFIDPAMGAATAAAWLTQHILGLLWRLIPAALYSALMTPLAIAVHRKVLLNESPSGRFFAPLASRRGQIFFAAGFSLAVFYTVATIVTWIVGFALTGGTDLPSAGDFELPGFGRITQFKMIAGLLAMVATAANAILIVRLAPAFPAIAVDRPGSWVTNGLTLSRRSAWRLFWVLGVVSVGISVVMFAIEMVLPLLYDFSWLRSSLSNLPDAILERTLRSHNYLLWLLVNSAGGALLVATLASALSHFYRARTAGPAATSTI